MDFGIARAIDDGAATMTQTSAVIGTAQYLSPEQAAGEVVDARSDLYSAGCLLYELLTDRPPFTGDVAGVGGLPARARERPCPRRSWTPTCRRRPTSIVMRAMEKSPDDAIPVRG